MELANPGSLGRLDIKMEGDVHGKNPTAQPPDAAFVHISTVFITHRCIAHK